MATERQSPDVLLDQTNLSGAVSAIQDDPNAPDANWLTAVSNNAASICRASFSTPTGNPSVGADLQEFKIWVRKMGGTGTPKVRIELYENGALLATLLADTNVTSTSGVLHSGTWNANLLGTADGSLVECRIYGTQSGGGPSARATIEVGSVEWNVVYSAGVIVTPGTVGLTTTLYTPTVSVSNNITVIPGTLALAAILYIPLIILGTVVAPGVLALTNTLFVPTVEVATPGTTVTLGTASLVTTLFAPAVSLSDNQIVTPGLVALNLSAFTSVVTLSNNITVTPGLLALAHTVFAPSVSIGAILTPNTLALIFAAYAPTILVAQNTIITPSMLALILATWPPLVGVSSSYDLIQDDRIVRVETRAGIRHTVI